jgi:COP9 signalosome complex subunit 6
MLRTLTDFLASGQGKGDHGVLRSLAALVASLPASENRHFREEFETVCSFF